MIANQKKKKRRGTERVGQKITAMKTIKYKQRCIEKKVYI